MHNCERFGQLQYVRAAETFKVPIAPMGKYLVDMSNSILIFFDGCCLDLPVWSTCHLRLKLQKFPSPRWEFLADMQFDSRLHNCGRRSYQLQPVRPAEDLESSHRPDGKMADMPKSTLIFRFGLIFGSIRDLYVPATPANFPSPPWETHVLLVFTGRRCLCLFRHRHNDVLLDHRQHSFWIGACS